MFRQLHRLFLTTSRIRRASAATRLLHKLFARCFVHSRLLQKGTPSIRIIKLKKKITQDVEPLGIDIDHVVITALSTGLSVPVRVACLEQREGKPQVHFLPSTTTCLANLIKIIDFFNENASISLLFRPGHYDILYN